MTSLSRATGRALPVALAWIQPQPQLTMCVWIKYGTDGWSFFDTGISGPPKRGECIDAKNWFSMGVYLVITVAWRVLRVRARGGR